MSREAYAGTLSDGGLPVNREELLHAYRKMLLIRRFEERLDELFARGVIRGTSHLCAGQDAVAVGACMALQAQDYVTSNHRGHGHMLAKGGDVKRVMAELFGKATGYSGGRGGSQHMACVEIGFLGSNGITGGGLPIATGAALALQMQKRDSVVLCFFGDGAANTGAFHESLNMAAVWRLPIIYLCENNGYAMSTPFAEAFAIEHVADRAAAYGMPGVVVDGCDVLAVREAVAAAASRARASEGPTLVEVKTYRYYGHSKSDKCEYRTREEEADWKARDPIELLAARLQAEGAATQEELAEVSAAVKADIEAAVAFAESSPEPEPETLREGLFAAGGDLS